MSPIINIYFALYLHIGSGLWREYQSNKEQQFKQPYNGTSWKILNAIRRRSKRLSSL